MADGTGARRPTRTILVLTAAMVAVATAVMVPLRSQDAPVDGAPISPWVLVALFALADLGVVHIHIRRHAHTFSLVEAPLVVGVTFFSPLTVLVARLIGSGLALVTVRRQRPLKLVFNLALFAQEIALVAGLLHLTGANPVEPVGWTVLLIGTLATLLLGVVIVAFVIGAVEGTKANFAASIRGGLGAVTTALAVGSGLLATTVLRSAPHTWVLLAAGAAVTALAVRAHADLRERHQRLERAYEFTTDAVASIEIGQDRTAILERACEVLRAEWAELAIGSSDSGESFIATNRGGELRIMEGDLATSTIAARARLLAGRSSAIVDGGPADGFGRAVVASVPGRDGVEGTFLVADRLGSVDRFGETDQRLLETLATQTAIVLRNRALLDRLRDEVVDRHHRALHDPLTQLPNRVFLAAELDRALAERPDHGTVAVLLVDLDRFKEVNDTLGHQQGDQLLQDVAERIRRSLPDRAVVARLGGDEFAILLPADLIDGVPAAEAFARRLLAVLSEPFPLAELLVDVGGSVGIAACPHHASDAIALLQRADVAMYASKSTGAGATVYDPADDRTSKERLGLVAELRTAIERKELHVEFQPIVEMLTGRPVGAEALCRWYHPTRGMVPPDVFVPVAEASSLIRPMTELVLSIALNHARRWRLSDPHLGVSVNLSTRNLLDDDFPDVVARLLAEFGVPPSALTLEVTESTIMSEPARSIGVVSRLSAMGVRLSIDDFGTGYSSLSQLHHLPVDELKVDRSFVRDLAHRSEDLAIVKAIVDLGRALDLEVTAEGVEDNHTMQLLAGVGCHHAQGYHVARPLSPALFDKWLRRRHEEEVALRALLPPPSPVEP